jgi:hypothetical protein
VLPLTGCRPAGPTTQPPARVGRGQLEACDKLLPLRFGSPIRASTRSGLDQLRASCVRGTAPECVFELQVERRSELRVALETGELDGSLALFERATTGAPARELRCVDDTPTGDLHHTRLDMTLGPGRYVLVVDGEHHQAGDFELFAELEPLGSIGEACVHAAPLRPGAPVRDSTRGGTNLFSATCGGGAQGPEHVRTLELAEPGRVRIRQHAEFDGSLYLRAQCEDASTERVCNDDFQSNARSMIAARLPAGTYYVFSDSYSREQSGDYALMLEQLDEPSAAPGQTACSEAAQRPMLSGHRELDTLYGSFAFAGSCGGKDTPELALTLRVEEPTTLVAKLDDAEFNAVMYLQKSCGDARSEVACYVAPRVDRPPSEQEMSSPALVAPLDPGVYTLVIDGYEANDMGAATLRLLFTP